jgi:two-component system, NarL family, sensor histidine kinase UhpB
MPAPLDILLLEDQPADAEAVEAELRGAGVSFRVRRVDSRAAFLAALVSRLPEVILSDFSLTDFSAFDALALLREQRLEVPFILITGNRSEEVAVECIHQGADDYILKASLRRLPTSLKNALEKRAAAQARAAAEAANRALPRLIREAQEAERRRVARDLHDSVNQILSAVKFRLNAVEEKLQDRPGAADAWRDVLQARAHLEKAMDEVRCISRNLRPSELDDLGLAAAVRSLGSEFGERTGFRLDLQLGEWPAGLPAEAELQLYRILQEALGNIERHAGARRVEVRLESDPAAGLLRLQVRDDGRGFDPSRARTGMGLVDMRERAEFQGGRCVVHSAPGRGTEILVVIPAVFSNTI